MWYSTVILLGLILQGTHAQTDTCSLSDITQPGDVTFAIHTNTHEQDVSAGDTSVTWCGRVTINHVEMIAAIQWIFEKLSGSYIPGVTIGYEVVDDCSKLQMTSHTMMDMFPQLLSSTCSPAQIPAVFSVVTSGQSEILAESLESSKVPILSVTTTAPFLSQYDNHFRTVPSDVQQIRAIKDILVKLKIYYVAVIYTDELYGRQGGEGLVDYLKNNSSVCVGFSTALSADLTNIEDTVTDELLEMLDQVSEQDTGPPVLGVVYFGQEWVARKLVDAVDRLREDSGHVAQRFIWIMTDAVENDGEIFQGHLDFSQNVFVITQVNIEIEEFTSHWLSVLASVLDGNVTTRFMQEYVEALLDCSFEVSWSNCGSRTMDDLAASYVQSSFVVSAIGATYAYSYALKSFHRKKCGESNPGVCPEMTNNFDEFIEEVRLVDFNYPGDFGYAPSELYGRRVGFNSEGDPLVDPGSEFYHINYLRCSSGTGECTFDTIGSYDGELTLDLSSVSLHLNPGSDTETRVEDLVPITCEIDCMVCLSDNSLPFAYTDQPTPRPFIIEIYLSIHNRGTTPFTCDYDDLMSRMTELTEVALFAVDYFNAEDGPFAEYAGNMAVVVLDDCRNPVLYGINAISDVHSVSILLNTSSNIIYEAKDVVAVIGGHYSSVNLAFADITARLYKPQLAYAATSIALSAYPHFSRTVPADDVQALVMVKYIASMGWQTFGIVYQDDAYGRAGLEALELYAKEAGLCVSVTKALKLSATDADMIKVLTTLVATRGLSVVVLFLSRDEAVAFLKAFKSGEWPTDYIWIGTESWGTDDSFLTHPDISSLALGSITLGLQTNPLAEAQAYFDSLTPANNQRNPFFAEWWEDHFTCVLPNSVNRIYDTPCEPDLALEGLYGAQQLGELIMNAVFAIGIGVSNAVPELCEGVMEKCAEVDTERGMMTLVEKIREAKLPWNQKNIFTPRGDGNVEYKVYNTQMDANGNHFYQEVAHYVDDDLVKMADPVFYDEDGNPVAVESICVENCADCTPPDGELQLLRTQYLLPGDIILFTVLPMHESPNSDSVSPEGLKALETLITIIKMINDEGQLLPDMKLGLHVVDSLSDPATALWMTLSKLRRVGELVNVTFELGNLVALLSAGPDDVTLAVTDVLDMVPLVHMDTNATLSSLFLPDANPYFVPISHSSKVEVEALVTLLLHYNWRYLTLFYSDTVIGRDYLSEFKAQAERSSICMLSPMMLEADDEDANRRQLQSWLASDHRATIVVILAEADILRSTLKQLDFLLSSGAQEQIQLVGGYRFMEATQDGQYTDSTLVQNALCFGIPNHTPSDRGLQVIAQLKNNDDNTNDNPWYSSEVWQQQVMQKFTLSSVYDVTVENVIAGVTSFAEGLRNYRNYGCQGSLITDCLQDSVSIEQLAIMIRREAAENNDDYVYTDYDLFVMQESGGQITRTKIGQYFFAGGTLSILDNSAAQLDPDLSECPIGDCTFCNPPGPSTESAPSSTIYIAIIVVLAVAIVIIIIVAILLVRRERTPQKIEEIPEPAHMMVARRGVRDHLPAEPDAQGIDPRFANNRFLNSISHPSASMGGAYQAANPSTAKDTDSGRSTSSGIPKRDSPAFRGNPSSSSRDLNSLSRQPRGVQRVQREAPMPRDLTYMPPSTQSSTSYATKGSDDDVVSIRFQDDESVVYQEPYSNDQVLRQSMNQPRNRRSNSLPSFYIDEPLGVSAPNLATGRDSTFPGKPGDQHRKPSSPPSANAPSIPLSIPGVGLITSRTSPSPTRRTTASQAMPNANSLRPSFFQFPEANSKEDYLEMNRATRDTGHVNRAYERQNTQEDEDLPVPPPEFANGPTSLGYHKDAISQEPAISFV